MGSLRRRIEEIVKCVDYVVDRVVGEKIVDEAMSYEPGQNVPAFPDTK